MSVLIAPAVSAATSLLSQSAAIRARKIASDIAAAQASNNNADQSYLMVVQRNPQSPPTRYEYDKMVEPYNAAIQSGDVDTLRSVGLWTEAYIEGVARAHPRPYGPAMLPGPTVLPPPGATAQMPAGAPPEGLPNWALPVGIAAVGVLLLTMFMGKRKRS